MPIDIALRGILIGISLGAPVGPVNIEIARRGLRSGFFSGWLVGVGAVTADTIYCLAVIAGISPLIEQDIVRTLLWIFGGLFLLYLGYGSIQAGRETQDVMDEATHGSIARRSFPTGFLIAALNPMGIFFWLSVGGGLVASGIERASIGGIIAIVSGVILGLGLWITTLSTLVHWGRHLISDRLFRFINLGSGVVLIGFGVWFLVQAGGGLF